MEMKTKKEYKTLGTPRTIGELKSLIDRYPDETLFGFRNQPVQDLQEVKGRSGNIYVVFIETEN